MARLRLDDEEARVLEFPSLDRPALGAYYTPALLVEAVFEAVAPLVPRHGPLAIVDPSCGAGAFLATAGSRYPRARLLGLELSAEVAAFCRDRLPNAVVAQGDALRGGLNPLLEGLPRNTFELWVGNPPYNGTSSVLKDPAAYAAMRARWPSSLVSPRGTSFRDDFAFFLLEAIARLRHAPGAIAFITPSTLLDGFIYAPLRRVMLEQMSLHEVLELGEGIFAGTKVKTCVTIWSSRSLTAARYRRRATSTISSFAEGQLSTPVALSPRAPDFVLRPPDLAAAALDAEWTERGERITDLIPISFPGLKTRFDELLVDDDPERLLQRVTSFLEIPLRGLPSFARTHDIPESCLGKLRALKLEVGAGAMKAERRKVRRFFRYAGARHRMTVPPEARAWCYLDRALIPRGDHRLRGDYDPHACATKLLFNIRELPLCAAVVDEEGCVHAHRHSRFAPLWVPQRVLREGLSAARPGEDLGPWVENLSDRGLEWSKELGGSRALFAAVAAFVNSEEVQTLWAPAYGAACILPVVIR